MLGNDCSLFVMAVIRHRLDYLSIPEDDLKKFADDFQKNRIHETNRRFWVFLSAISFIHPIVDSLVRMSSRSQQYEELCIAIQETFLLSSDFFFHAADTSRTINYIGSFDPWERPCSNPFARFDFDK